MRLFNRIVLESDRAKEIVLDYVPRTIQLPTPEQAIDYLEAKAQGSDFKMADVIRQQTKIDEVEAASMELQVETKVLEKIQEIQESAYKEAYNLGLDEGKKEAFLKATGEIEERLSKLDGLIETIKTLKSEMVKQNESHIIELVYHIAKRIVSAEVQRNPELVMAVMKEAAEMAQLEESVKVEVNPEQVEFLEKLKKETGRHLDFLKKMSFIPNESISVGGCVISTNYGVIDSRIEERVSKVWETLSESLTRVKDRISAA